MTDLEISERLAARARAGDVLTDAELHELNRADVLSLGMLADEVRRARAGAGVSYTRVYEPTDDATPDVVATLAASGVELRLPAPGASLDETLARIAALRVQVGRRARLTGFSLGDIIERGWAEPVRVLAAFKDAGLDGIADAAVDVVEADALDAVHAAGLALGALSVQRMPDQRVPILLQARRALQGRAWVQAFAPLSREQSIAAPTTGYHDVRMVALARLALPGVGRIQVDWAQYGPKLAQVALTFGASHLDRVSPIDDPALGRRRASVEEVRRNIAAAGFTPVEEGATA